MKKAIIGKKIGMTQIFKEDGTVVPVTVVEAGPCTVVQKKTVETDGYDAVQLAFGDIKEKNVTKPVKGHFDKYGVKYARVLREFRLDDCSALEPGQELKADVLKSAIMLMFQAVQKVKDTLARSSAGDSREGQWLTVLNTTVQRVLWVLLPTRHAFRRINTWPARWGIKMSQH